MTDDDIWNEYVKSIKKIDNKFIKRTVHTNTYLNKNIDNNSSNPEHETLFNHHNKQSIIEHSFNYFNKKKRRQNLPIESKIDLHGLTQDQAFEELNNFLKSAYHNNKKNILIITGKGKLSQPGVIRLAVPRWLRYTEIKQYILSFSTAENSQGGEGAISVLLKSKER